MSDLLSEMESDSFTPSDLPDNAELQDVSSIAEKVQQKQKAIKTLETNLKSEKEALLKLTDEDLPSAMAEMNLSSFRLANGAEVSVKNTYGAHIKKDNQQAAFDWLRAHGHGDIIKNTVSVDFGKGEDNEANAFLAEAKQQGYAPAQKTSVHAQTLLAWVKERLEKGEEIDADLFGVWTGQRATIKGN